MEQLLLEQNVSATPSEIVGERATSKSVTLLISASPYPQG